MKSSFLTIILLFFLFCSFHPPAKNGDKQGVKGYVKEVAGNQMPSPDVIPSAPKGVKTTVYIYAKTNISQVEREGTEPFYKSINTRFIRSVSTTSSGYFFVALPVGSYSLFTKVDGRFYANSFDDVNNIALVEVVKNKVTDVNITLSSKANF